MHVCGVGEGGLGRRTWIGVKARSRLMVGKREERSLLAHASARHLLHAIDSERQLRSWSHPTQRGPHERSRGNNWGG